MAPESGLELWGGVECTVARLGDRYRNQSVETGHAARADDLDRIAALGIRTVRYPVVWETVSPDRPDEADWRWHDERLPRLRELGIRPIAGLLHHGSGPRHTNLLDPAFPALFAEYAAQVAARYPWISHYTPVNEPLTTARFSALYGHWYPHARSDTAFLGALVGQCLGTVLAMRAIRAVNPAAQLVQTDDLGRTFSTPALAHQAEYENGRRWLTFDLLCGRVDRHHAWWPILCAHGITEAVLETFLEGDCAPDVIGINHYLTSDRYLDSRVEAYPESFRGGNHAEHYADVEAVRMPGLGGSLGAAARLMEAWQRYQRPLAITEVHHGCTREEQLRWLVEVWEAAKAARRQGADIRAVTAWSMFGAVDWNSLLTRENGIYEPGLFDVRGPEPRPTVLAHAAGALATRGAFDHPVLDGPGWWRREDRFYSAAARHHRKPAAPARRLVILGAGTPAGEAFARICGIRGLAHDLVSPAWGVDPAPLAALPQDDQPWAVIDTALSAPDALLAWCREHGTRYLAVSATPLFSPRDGLPYDEADRPDAGDPGARRAAIAEARLASSCPDALIVRAGPVFGPWDSRNFAARMLQALASGDRLDVPAEIVSPSYLPDLAHVALDLLIDGESGIWHLPNAGQASWAELARMLADRAGLTDAVIAVKADQAALTTALVSGRGTLLAPLASALDRYVDESVSDWSVTPVVAGIAAE
jgi:dTDP-4-dehydrorhamnose reductase